MYDMGYQWLSCVNIWSILEKLDWWGNRWAEQCLWPGAIDSGELTDALFSLFFSNLELNRMHWNFSFTITLCQAIAERPSSAHLPCVFFEPVKPWDTWQALKHVDILQRWRCGRIQNPAGLWGEMRVLSSTNIHKPKMIQLYNMLNIHSYDMYKPQMM